MIPEISVIVPVYNAEPYLHRCLDSLLAQSFSNFELLLVDDGSTDCSGTLCDQYASRDSRVSVFHKQNGGVSSARNVGIKNAKGVYTIHVDPDDWVDPTMLAELHEKAVAENADVVICDFFVNERGRDTYCSQRPQSLLPKDVRNELFSNLHGSCCNKLIRRSCFDGRVKFDESISFCEDKLFVCETLAYVTRVSYLGKAFYHYFQDTDDSLSRRAFTDETLARRLKLFQLFRDRVKEVDETLIRKDEAFTLLCDAYRFSAYSSEEFQCRFESYAPLVRTLDNVPLSMKLFWWLACKGYLSQAKKLDRLWSKIRGTK